MMSLTIAFGASARPKSARVCAQAAALSFSVLPSTRSVSGMAAKVCGSVCAAQPVTTIFACGRSRRSARIVCRAWRTASAVTAQVLTTTVSLQPGALRLAADHFRLGGIEPAAEGDDFDAHRLTPLPRRQTSAASKRPVVLVFDRPGHQHMVVALAPFDREIAAGQRDRHLAAGAIEPRRGDGGGASRRAAGLGEAGAALPGADHHAIARGRRRQRDIGALGKQRMVLELRADLAQIVGLRIVDPEDRMRIAHAHDGRRAQDRRAGRRECQIDRARIGHFLAPAESHPSENAARPCRP